MGMDMDNDQRAMSSSEEKDNLTPAQSRRKAQNRAASVRIPLTSHLGTLAYFVSQTTSIP